MLLGRERDLAFLNRAYQAEGAQLLVLYGQRRCGKTALLREFSRSHPHIYYQACSCSAPVQRALFFECLKQAGAQEGPEGVPTWRQALQAFASLPLRGRKRLLLVDEFPRLLPGGRPPKEEDFLSALLSLWREQLSREEVCIVLSGSDEAFFEKKLPKLEEALYASVSGIRKLLPLRPALAGLFLPGHPVLEQFQAQALLGGSPAYLSCLDPSLSLEENLQRELLSPRGRLSREIPLLLLEDLREVSQYQSLLYAIARGESTLSAITRVAMPNNSAKCAVYLKTLEEISLVEKQTSLPISPSGDGPGGRGTYRLTRPLFRFWYAFVFPHLSLWEEERGRDLYEIYVKPELDRIYQLALEEAALDYLWEAKKRGELPFAPALIGPWFGKTTTRSGEKTLLSYTRIPALACNQDRTRFLVAACSYGECFSFSRYLDERMKLLPLQAQADFSYYLFSTHGFDPKLTALEKESPQLTLLPLEELMRLPRSQANDPPGATSPLLSLDS